MPKVKKVKARKDYPSYGIKKGDEHYVRSMKTGPRSGVTRRSKTQPKPSQLTTSEFLGEVYALQEEIADAAADSLDELEGMRDDWKSRIEEIGSTCQEKFDNLPEGFQQGDTGQLLEERANAMQQWADDLDNVDLSEIDESELEGLTDEEKEAKKLEHVAELLEELRDVEPEV